MNPIATDPYVLATHLSMIQGIINRLGQDSFFLKGWSVTLIVALLAFAARDRDDRIALLALIPSVAFWLLDAYYLWQERRFRDLYKAVAEGKLPGNYAMNLTDAITSKKYRDALFSVTGIGFHGPLLGTVVVLLCFILTRRRP